MARTPAVIPPERIASRIYLIRGEKVMLDSDLADLYGVRTGRLNEQFNATETGFRRTLPSSLPALNSIL